ncbi:hypothetical protein M407DRAFT_10057 [Tulasnella calospora MUT 4182]|uniref:Uncharacterized protein n=1 Tax=Tulasnella calospora MUT 4182 TaxID=1051891 RepID=A0A0C3Q1M4_9AGAM|nr:hypothetical protein M407DRAFT_10057 [Tulasnella calospora MUT 4182]
MCDGNAGCTTRIGGWLAGEEGNWDRPGVHEAQELSAIPRGAGIVYGHTRFRNCLRSRDVLGIVYGNTSLRSHEARELSTITRGSRIALCGDVKLEQGLITNLPNGLAARRNEPIEDSVRVLMIDLVTPTDRQTRCRGSDSDYRIGDE